MSTITSIGGLAEVRRAVAAAIRAAKKSGAASVAVVVPTGPGEMLEAATQGAVFGDWESDAIAARAT